MVFVGTYDHTIDAKNRLAIPSEVRGMLQRSLGIGGDDPIRLYVIYGAPKALYLYTEEGFAQRAAELDNSPMQRSQLLEWERLMFSLAQQVEIDKAGRVRLPEAMLKRAGLSGDVVLLGVKDHMEVRDRQTWHEHVEAVLAASPGVLMDPRLAMAPGGGGGPGTVGG